MTRAEIATLAKLDGYKVRALWRAARRDRVFLVGGLLLVAFAGFGARWLFIGVAKRPELFQLLLPLACGAGAFLALVPQRGSRAVVELANGPFQPLVSTPLLLSQWLAMRTVVLLLAAAILITPILASADAARAAKFMALCLVGVAAAAIGYLALSGSSTTTTTTVVVPRQVRRHSADPLLLLVAVATRRSFGLPIWLIVPALALFAATGAPLAAHNNNEPGVGATLGAAAAILAGVSLFNGPRLIQTLGKQAMPLPRLYLWLFAPGAAVAALIGLVAAVLSGADLKMTLEVAASAGGATAAFGLVYMLHALTRVARVLPGSLFAEAFALNLFFTYMSLLWPVWVTLRLYLLVRAARRLRWLDR